MVFVNETGVMFTLINYATVNITGSIEMTLLAVLLLMTMVGLMFRLPVELIVLILIPMTITFMAFDSGLVGFGGIMLLILGSILALKWLFVK